MHDDSVDQDFVVTVLAIFTAYVTHGLFMEPRFYEFMNVVPFMLAGIVVGSYQRRMLGSNHRRI